MIIKTKSKFNLILQLKLNMLSPRVFLSIETIEVGSGELSACQPNLLANQPWAMASSLNTDFLPFVGGMECRLSLTASLSSKAQGEFS